MRREPHSNSFLKGMGSVLNLQPNSFPARKNRNKKIGLFQEKSYKKRLLETYEKNRREYYKKLGTSRKGTPVNVEIHSAAGEDGVIFIKGTPSLKFIGSMICKQLQRSTEKGRAILESAGNKGSTNRFSTAGGSFGKR